MSIRCLYPRSLKAPAARNVAAFLPIVVIATVMLCDTVAHGQMRRRVNNLRLDGYVGAAPAGQRTIADLTLRAGQTDLRFQVTNLTVVSGNVSTIQVLASVRPQRPNFVLRGPQELLAQVGSAAPGTRLRIQGTWRLDSQTFSLSSVENRTTAAQTPAP